MFTKPKSVKVFELKPIIDALRQKREQETVPEIVDWLEQYQLGGIDTVLVLQESLGLTLIQAKGIVDAYDRYKRKKLEQQQFYDFCRETVALTLNKKRN